MSPQPHAPANDWAEHVFAAALGGIDMLAIHLGDRLGWYRALADGGALTADELAQRTDTSPRYAREWLEQQATSGFLEAATEAVPMKFSLPKGAAEALTDERSLAYIAPLARMLAAAAVQMPALIDAYRTGRGVSWEQLGDDARWSQGEMNRPWFESALADAIAGVPDGVVVVMDEGVGDGPLAVGDQVERLMYGFSLFVCLPDGMSSQPSAATGTVMRPSTLTGYAKEAGFADVSVLPIDDFSFFRFYRLHQEARAASMLANVS